MSKKHDKHIERQLIDVVNSQGNDNKCGECKAAYPTWASWNLGILLCGRCASIHRRILGGQNISKVKSLTLDHWTNDQVDNLRRIGNKRASKKWNQTREPFPFDDDDDGPIEDFIRDKYVLLKFRTDTSGAGFGDHDRYSDDSGNNLTPQHTSSRSRSNSNLFSRNKSRSRASSSAVPRLTHRTLTAAEQSQYSSQVRNIVSLGYRDRDSVLESLVLANGITEFALDILDQDAKNNPQQQELPPQLPRRPTTNASSNNGSINASVSSFSANNPMNQLVNSQQPSSSSNDWWASNNGAISANQTGAPNAASMAALSNQPQIYQYTDPVTGQVSYVDANGQQYLDPNNPQHQQVLQQQTNPQLIAQQTSKSNIMSLYNQPGQFETNVATKIDPSQSQQQQPPQQQQQQFTGFQQPMLGQATQSQQLQSQQFTGFQQPQISPFGQPHQQTGGSFGQQPQQTGFPFGQPQVQQLNQQPQQQQQFGQFGQPQQGYWG